MCYKIKLDSIPKAEEFVKICSLYHEKEDIDIVQGRYLVNGKSLLGILSLNLTLPMYVQYETPNEMLKEHILKFCVE